MLAIVSPPPIASGRPQGIAMESVARQVKALREERGLTQRELGMLLDCRQSWVSRLERVASEGRPVESLNVTLETLERVAYAFGLALRVTFTQAAPAGVTVSSTAFKE